MATQIQPLGRRVLIQRDTAKDRTESGIFLPEAAKEAPSQGLVIATGPDVGMPKDGSFPSTDVKRLQAGDKVLFLKYAGNDVEVGDQKYVLMNEDDVLGILVPETEPKTEKAKK